MLRNFEIVASNSTERINPAAPANSQNWFSKRSAKLDSWNWHIPSGDGTLGLAIGPIPQVSGLFFVLVAREGADTGQPSCKWLNQLQACAIGRVTKSSAETDEI